MKRYIDLKDISDGRLYHANDMVKVDCNGCEGCFSCCQNMGTSIILDPYDIFSLRSHLSSSFEQLLTSGVELNVTDGILLPNLKMNTELKCYFLNDQGRCSIHPFRPGICRLFPLGRYYEKHQFQYFIQTHECKKELRLKAKIKKWIDTPNLKEYENFILQWHCLILDLQELVLQEQDQEFMKKVNLHLLNLFFTTDYIFHENFYPQFFQRLQQIRQTFFPES